MRDTYVFENVSNCRISGLGLRASDHQRLHVVPVDAPTSSPHFFMAFFCRFIRYSRWFVSGDNTLYVLCTLVFPLHCALWLQLLSQHVALLLFHCC